MLQKLLKSEYLKPRRAVTCELNVHIHWVTVEVTLVTVKERGIAEALVINTSGSPVSLKHGVRLSQCLVYEEN